MHIDDADLDDYFPDYDDSHGVVDTTLERHGAADADDEHVSWMCDELRELRDLRASKRTSKSPSTNPNSNRTAT